MMHRPVFTIALVVFGCALTVGSLPAQERPAAEADSLELARSTLQKWVETQQIISREKREWKEAREILRSRIELLRTEVTALEEKIQHARDGAAEADRKKTELIAQGEAIQAATDLLRQNLRDLEGKVRHLYSLLPEPLQAKVNLLYQRMPADPDQTRVSLVERFQNVLGILNEVNKLNGEITLATEVRSLGDGKPAEVKTLYVGLGQAYYLSARGEAGVGRPGTDGWHWEPANAFAQNVSDAIDILQNKGTPRFVPLPVRIQ